MTNEVLYRKILRRLGVKNDELLGPCRRPSLVDARCLMAAALMEQPYMRQKEIAKILHTSQGAICKMLKRHRRLMDVDHDYRSRWDNVSSLFDKTNSTTLLS